MEPGGVKKKAVGFTGPKETLISLVLIRQKKYATKNKVMTNCLQIQRSSYLGCARIEKVSRDVAIITVFFPETVKSSFIIEPAVALRIYLFPRLLMSIISLVQNKKAHSWSLSRVILLAWLKKDGAGGVDCVSAEVGTLMDFFGIFTKGAAAPGLFRGELKNGIISGRNRPYPSFLQAHYSDHYPPPPYLENILFATTDFSLDSPGHSSGPSLPSWGYWWKVGGKYDGK